MTNLRYGQLIIAALFLGGLITTNAHAGSDPTKEGGIGGTGSAANTKGIGGTGAPVQHGGIGGTGLQPNDETTKEALAGKVLFIVGRVEAQNMGQIRSLSKGDPVREGDTLKSGKGASLQLRMEDGGTIVLRSESQLAIESFEYKGKQDGSEHIAIALLSGGFRAVTGEIGHLHKENYSIRTPNATVGIRGTDHETVFVARSSPGQTAVVEPGTYNHVISGATLLQSEQGKLLIKPNQTGFAALNGATPVILAKPLPIFGNPVANPEQHGEHYEELNNPGNDMNENNGLSDATSGTEQSKLTQTDRLANSSVDLNTLETDSLSAASGSGAVGAHMAVGRLLATGGAQVGNLGDKLSVEDNFPTGYSNDATGFNYVANDTPPIQSGATTLDGVNVTWGIYAGGVAFDTSGRAITIDFHPFAFAKGGVTSPSAISAIGGTAAFSNVVGNTQPVTETGALGGTVSLNVGVNLGAGTLTSYNLAVTDANSRNWTGALSGSVPLSAFANGTSLAVTCTCPGATSGSAAGMLVGPNAKGLISSYLMSTTSGSAVAGAVVMSRP